MGVDRVPVSFTSECQGNIYRHIVLLIHHEGLFGALGLSRRKDLMDKPLTFDVCGFTLMLTHRAWKPC